MSDQGAAYREVEVGYFKKFFMDLFLKKESEKGLESKSYSESVRLN
jgi:hypothetical protein